MSNNPTLISHFTFDQDNDATKYQFSGVFGSGKCTQKLQFEKYKRAHRVTVTVDGKLKCEFCNYCLSFGSPCRHVIACNRQNVCISDFHIRNTKSYNCGSMDGKVERKFGDYGLPLFRGSYEASEIKVKDCNETIINDKQSNTIIDGVRLDNDDGSSDSPSTTLVLGIIAMMMMMMI